MKKIEGQLKVEHDYSLDIFKISDDNGFLYYDVTVSDNTEGFRYSRNMKIFDVDVLRDFIRGLI